MYVCMCVCNIYIYGIHIHLCNANTHLSSHSKDLKNLLHASLLNPLLYKLRIKAKGRS